VNALGAATIVKPGSGGVVALAQNDLNTGAIAFLVYHAPNWELENSGTSGSAVASDGSLKVKRSVR